MNDVKLKLKTKLMAGFAIPIIALMIIASVVYNSLNAMVESNGWVSHTHKVIGEGEKILAAMVDMETGMRGFMVAGKDNFLEPYHGGGKTFNETISQLKVTVNDNPAQVSRLEQIQALGEQWKVRAAEPQIELRRKVTNGSATMADVVALIGQGNGKASMDALRGKIAEFVGEEQKLIVVRNAEAQAISDRTVSITIIGTLVAILFASLVGFILVRGVQRQIGGEPEVMADISKRIAEGDLTVEMTNTGQETGVYAAMAEMVRNLRDTVGQVMNSSELIDNATTELTDGNTNLSQRTEEQASSLEETAASMEEMTGTVKQNADSAQQAAQIANAARSDAEQGGQVVNKAVDAMGAITESSTRIADIITTIDGIAFQTNLLALNAAVEAARAGEQGRGFAVVASEVRSLAQRSAEAAKEIKGLIEDSVDKVKNGTELVDQSGKTLLGIVDGVKKVADIIAEINAASQEQSSGIDQVNGAIANMDDMTQQNAALVEEASATSRAVKDQAQSLLELMQFFNLGQRTASGARRTMAAQPSAIQNIPAKAVGQNVAFSGQAPKASKKTGTDSQEWEDF